MQDFNLDALTPLIEARRQWLRNLGDEYGSLMGTRVLSFNLGRQAGHTSFIARHAMPDDLVVSNTGMQSEYVKTMVARANRGQPYCIGRMAKAAAWLAGDTIEEIGDLWIDEPAWDSTAKELPALLAAWGSKRRPDALVITLGGVYRIA